jgi:hypothetical protein
MLRLKPERGGLFPARIAGTGPFPSTERLSGPLRFWERSLLEMNKSSAPPYYLETVAGDCPRANAELAMCEKCVEIDSKIEHYQGLASRVMDQPTIDGIQELIEHMKAQKAALHPEQAK